MPRNPEPMLLQGRMGGELIGPVRDAKTAVRAVKATLLTEPE